MGKMFEIKIDHLVEHLDIPCNRTSKLLIGERSLTGRHNKFASESAILNLKLQLTGDILIILAAFQFQMSESGVEICQISNQLPILCTGRNPKLPKDPITSAVEFHTVFDGRIVFEP